VTAIARKSAVNSVATRFIFTFTYLRWKLDSANRS